MTTLEVESLEHYLSILPYGNDDFALYRGQRERKNLLPNIARDDPTLDTTDKEIEMLAELRRMGAMYIERGHDDWDLMILAQHFGMNTRLLDWTSNPLTALWFACSNAQAASSSYVYLLIPEKKDFLDRTKHTSPFTSPRTLVLKPTLNNPRIIAQNGWFTAHIFSKKPNQWVPLNVNNLMREKVVELEIPGRLKRPIQLKLDTMGMNHSALFPGMEGLCRHINWIHS